MTRTRVIVALIVTGFAAVGGLTFAAAASGPPTPELAAAGKQAAATTTTRPPAPATTATTSLPGTTTTAAAPPVRVAATTTTTSPAPRAATADPSSPAPACASPTGTSVAGEPPTGAPGGSRYGSGDEPSHIVVSLSPILAEPCTTVTATVTVSPSGGTTGAPAPSGVVDFAAATDGETAGTAATCTLVATASGSSSCSATFVWPGGNSVFAAYAGDSTYTSGFGAASVPS